MTPNSIALNALKTFLVLGVSFGGHHIYNYATGGTFIDDGSFYFSSKMLMPGSKDHLLKKNKVYNSPSPIKDSGYFSQAGYSNVYLDFDEKLGFGEKASVLKTHYSKQEEIYKIIKDHTLKMVMPCQSGTGWLLDFELPEGGKYPLKWFLATNLHVINKFRFKDNPYHSSLPITDSSARQYAPAHYNSWTYRYNNLTACQDSIFNNKSVLDLYTEEDIRDVRELGRSFAQFHHGGTWDDNYCYYDVRMGAGICSKPHQRPNQPRVFTTKVTDPKLVYSAVNFLGSRNTVSGHQVQDFKYFKDFGVLEINFENEEQARLMTNNVYEKYYKEKTDPNKKVAIDFFAEELMSKYDPNQLAKAEDSFFIGGYPYSPTANLSFHMNQKFRPLGNYSWDYQGHLQGFTVPTESKLTYFRKTSYDSPNKFNLLNSRGEVIPGHADLKKIDDHSNASKIEWDGYELSGWGYNYMIDNAFLGKGASGSMVLDQNGSLLGLYRMYNEGFNYGFVEPLKASWVIDDQGRVILPGYDLLAGAGADVVSYRTQIEKYRPTMKTYLKSKNWKLKS
ncbi:hypothetical protein MHLP_03860 [Candidatus Mycoplasma haematolamae str. Purdue]|uniref:DUF31 domain-containing protein n=1 Tax=Mycoplasma haematolamae (strain Purdue) TaxID=1212765 RepID=I7C717_MYCHA|nr:hypothetical protein [Candidatus Mycoplasma haematolamae]AFO52352.1 hypothetical protein MHLP_03860 [Candidatus Mycoplasma haematolamae str. Purdue]